MDSLPGIVACILLCSIGLNHLEQTNATGPAPTAAGSSPAGAGSPHGAADNKAGAASASGTCPSHFSYENGAAKQWPQACPTCGGKLQSPICFDRENMAQLPGLKVTLQKYDVDQSQLPIENDGHSIKVTIPEKNAPSIILPHRPQTPYVLKQIHFHWGSSKKEGSEHCIGKEYYPGEMHLFHQSKKSDEAAVLGVFIEVGCQGSENQFLEAIGNVSKSLLPGANATKSTVPGTFKLADALPKDQTKFFSYRGSRTAPPCTENVDFIIFEQPAFVRKQFFDNLRATVNSDGSPNAVTYRPVQPLNGRMVYYTGATVPKGKLKAKEACSMGPAQPLTAATGPNNAPQQQQQAAALSSNSANSVNSMSVQQ